MINGYTESEICALYRQAKNKDLQIKILCQLTGLMDFKIIEILERGGYLVTDLEKLKELHTLGLSMKKMATELGIGVSTVNYHMKKLGLKPNGGGGRKKKEEIEVEDVVEKLKEETQKNVEELKEILPKPVSDPDDSPIEYDIVEELSPQQYYELAKITLELLKTIWG